MRNYLTALLTLGLMDLGVSADGLKVSHNIQHNLHSLNGKANLSQTSASTKEINYDPIEFTADG